MKIKSIVLSVLISFVLVLSAYAGAPLDTVRTNVDAVLDVLRNPALKAASAKDTKKAKLRSIYVRMFDDVELSKRTLAKNWNKLNTAQRKEFVHLYEQVLEKAYIDKILSYTNEKITYDKEEMMAGNRAEVHTTILTASKKIPISYRVTMSGGAWKVYDVIIENVSLVLNYRTQFNNILAKDTPEQMLETLRKKVKAQ